MGFFLRLFRKIFGSRDRLKFTRVFTPNNKPILYGRMKDWQSREILCRHLIYHVVYGKPLSVLNKIHKKLLHDFIYTPDKNYGDYWATSEEIMEGGLEDDCDGFAVYMWSRLLMEGFSDEEVGMCVVKGHMFAIYQPKGMLHDFYVIDNGYMTHEIVLASKLFPVYRNGNKLLPIFGFTDKVWWRYIISGLPKLLGDDNVFLEVG